MRYLSSLVPVAKIIIRLCLNQTISMRIAVAAPFTEYTFWSDLFSVGLCLYEMLCGETAYEDEGDMQKMLACHVHLGTKNCSNSMSKYVHSRTNVVTTRP